MASTPDVQPSDHIAIAQRFLFRLFLPAHHACRVLQITMHPDQARVKQFYELAQGRPVLELYHALSSSQAPESIASIFLHGLHAGSACNKGYGVYLANHGRYAWNWGGDHVFICHVVDAPGTLRRYRSEIYSPQAGCDSEFVFTATNATNAAGLLLLPVACIHFERQVVEPTTGPEKRNDVQSKDGFVQHGTFGCESCDGFEFVASDGHVLDKGKRCDCEQYPTVLAQDVI